MQLCNSIYLYVCIYVCIYKPMLTYVYMLCTYNITYKLSLSIYFTSIYKYLHIYIIYIYVCGGSGGQVAGGPVAGCRG